MLKTNLQCTCAKEPFSPQHRINHELTSSTDSPTMALISTIGGQTNASDDYRRESGDRGHSIDNDSVRYNFKKRKVAIPEEDEVNREDEEGREEEEGKEDEDYISDDVGTSSGLFIGRHERRNGTVVVEDNESQDEHGPSPPKQRTRAYHGRVCGPLCNSRTSLTLRSKPPTKK